MTERRTSGAVRPDDIRQHNLSLVLSHVHRDGALTRAELTQRLHLSRSTVGALVAELAQLELVKEVVPSGGERVGRPSHVVAPASSSEFGPFLGSVPMHLSCELVRNPFLLGHDWRHARDELSDGGCIV